MLLKRIFCSRNTIYAQKIRYKKAGGGKPQRKMQVELYKMGIRHSFSADSREDVPVRNSSAL